MGNQCVGAPGDENDHHTVTWNTQYTSNALRRSNTRRPTHAQSTTMMKLQRDKDMKIQRVNQYEMVKQLGKGSFGDVYLASEQSEKFAVKVLKKSALRRQRQGRFGSALDTVKAEIALMKKIRHPNCVGMVEVIDDPKADEVFIVLEFVDGGASQPIGKDGLPVRLKEATIWSHMRHLVLGLEYLHMNGIVHRDIKPENLLVSRAGGGMLKIADFGTALFVEASEDATHKTAGTPAFFAPEMCELGLAGTYDGRACDMWAVGVTLHLWAFGTAPFMAATTMLVMEMIKDAPPVVELPTGGAHAHAASEKLRRVMRALLTRDISRRMTLNQLRLDPWLTKENKAPLVAQPTVLVSVSDSDIANAITPLMQVSGHAGALARAGGTSLIKRSTREEYSFYEAIASSDIAQYVPILYGLQDDNERKTRKSLFTIGAQPAEAGPESHRAGEPECRIILQDLTAGMTAPCVMDIKVGVRTMLESDLSETTPREDLLKKMDLINPREARAEERKAGGITKARYLAYRDSLTSTSTLGFRIDAAVLSTAGGKEAKPLDFNFRQLKDEAKIRACFAAFFRGSKVLCRAVLIKLDRMRTACERSSFFHKAVFLRSSILITYDQDMHAELLKTPNATADDLLALSSPAALEVKMIDFAKSHVLPGGRTISHRTAWTPGSDEDGYLTGIDSLIGMLEKVHSSMS